MPKNEIREVKGKIIISEKDFNRMIQKNVMKNNKTSGKVLLPKNMVGNKVYVVWSEGRKKE